MAGGGGKRIIYKLAASLLPMITLSLATTDNELAAIIALQQQNLPQNLAQEEIAAQGFVTVSHSLQGLQKMNGYEKSLVIKDDDKVIGYLLAMTKNSKADIPILIPMFEVFDKILYHGKTIAEYNYLVVGQACIDKTYRGKGLLDEAYKAYKEHFNRKYDFAITEIALTNQRSINAHKRIGFSEIHKYIDAGNVEWSVVVWDWKDI